MRQAEKGLTFLLSVNGVVLFVRLQPQIKTKWIGIALILVLVFVTGIVKVSTVGRTKRTSNASGLDLSKNQNDSSLLLVGSFETSGVVTYSYYVAFPVISDLKLLCEELKNHHVQDLKDSRILKVSFFDDYEKTPTFEGDRGFFYDDSHWVADYIYEPSKDEFVFEKK